ncbi:unnamed protein product, partial [Adineta ricciae]
MNNNDHWSPNHFVPLMSASIRHEYVGGSQMKLINKTPEKKTTKNNHNSHVRIPEFQSSPSRRLRSETSTNSDHVEIVNLDTMEQNEMKREGQHPMRLITLEDRARLRRNKRSQSNRTNKKLDELSIDSTFVHQQDIHDHAYGNSGYIYPAHNSKNGIERHDSATNRNKIKDSLTWPAPVSSELKEECLKQFLQQMSMDNLAEVTCAVCNVRSSKQQCKIVPTSTISHKDLLKVSDELKGLITNIQLSIPKHFTGSPIQNSLPFYFENYIVLYKNGVSQDNEIAMCSICQNCSHALSKDKIPKFSAANNMWLGDIPTQLQGLTIPEQKLISLHRHNSCVIKLHSPFHTATTAQGALKGN